MLNPGWRREVVESYLRLYNHAPMFRDLLITLTVCLSLCPTVLGQRIFATIDPSGLEEGLTFDTNNIPLPNDLSSATTDLNFSPNVVFSSDRRAFVSYPGSNKVLVFDPLAGKLLEPQSLIEVGQNPVLMTLTPDGGKLAVVCLFLEDNLPQSGDNFIGKQIGAISIIDVETLSVQTLNLTEVFFSVANNIVFSEDGKTGFVASSGTDEIIRFDVENVTEITPRLKMTSGTRPSSITMAPKFSFFAVVLVGSTSLPVREVPDSIQMIDPDTFAVERSIVPAVENELFPPHDFLVSNTLAISPDGQFGLIGDQELGSALGLTGLFDDHAILLNLQTGETVLVFNIGGVPGGSFVIPKGGGESTEEKGGSFVIISGREVAIIDIQSQEDQPPEVSLTRVTPPFLGLKATTRPTFSADGTRMFVASAVRDFLMEFDLRNRVFTRSLDIGPRVDLVPAAPLDLSFSPDGTVIAAVKFNANTVALLQDTQRSIIPRVVSNQEFFTGIAVINNAAQQATIVPRVIDSSGKEIQDDVDTEEVEFQKPENLTLKAGQQASFTIRELLQAASGATLDGWLELESEQLQTTSLFLIGDTQLQRLDGGIANLSTSSLLILPEVRVNNGFRTEISIVNPNSGTATVDISLVNSDGSLAEEASIPVVQNAIATTFLRDPDPTDDTDEGLFTESALENFVDGYLRVSSVDGVVAFERYFDDQQLATQNGIPIGLGSPLAATLYLPHVAAFAGYETFVNLIYIGGPDSANVTLTLKGNQGEDLAAPVNREMEIGQSIRENLVELFNLTEQGSTITGWILIESDSPGIVGTAEIHNVVGPALTTITAQSSLMPKFVFSHVVQGSGISAGLALLNPASDTAHVLIEVFTAGGTLLDSLSLQLGGSQREVRQLGGAEKTFFPDLPELSGGYLKISSDQNIVGLEILFADNLDFLATVLPQPLAP